MREIDAQVKEEAGQLEKAGRLAEEKQYIQHGSTTVYEHSLHVAEVSRRLARHLPFKVNERALLRAALLHDYFLYDWHFPGDGTHRLHGFRHAKTAAKNAARDYDLSEKEIGIIRSHMFPLDPTHVPDSPEGWIVTLADKYCALEETLEGRGENGNDREK